jgi:catechol 2,3-dioxygenase-like lactoylglutathione lyase family enzyme
MHQDSIDFVLAPGEGLHRGLSCAPLHVVDPKNGQFPLSHHAMLPTGELVGYGGDEDDLVGLEQWESGADSAEGAGCFRQSQQMGRAHPIEEPKTYGRWDIEIRAGIQIQETNPFGSARERSNDPDFDGAVTSEHKYRICRRCCPVDHISDRRRDARHRFGALRAWVGRVRCPTNLGQVTAIIDVESPRREEIDHTRKAERLRRTLLTRSMGSGACRDTHHRNRFHRHSQEPVDTDCPVGSAVATRAATDRRSWSAVGRNGVSRPVRPPNVEPSSAPRTSWSAAYRCGCDSVAHESPRVRHVTIQRMDHVGIVVDDLEAAIAFFVELGMELDGGTTPVEGDWVDRVVGLDEVRVEIAFVRTPDGDGRLELTKFHNPMATTAEPNAPANTFGLRRIMFAADDIDEVVARMRAHGAELVGEVAQYEDLYRLCYLRGPGGIIVALAEQLR